MFYARYPSNHLTNKTEGNEKYRKILYCGSEQPVKSYSNSHDNAMQMLMKVDQNNRTTTADTERAQKCDDEALKNDSLF
jgi:hypothetical protein